jgi:phage-related minor tail protein
MTDEVNVLIQADTRPFARALEELKTLSDDFGRQLGGALKGAATGGEALEDVLRRIALNLAGTALDQGLKPLQGLASSFVSTLVGGLGGIMPFARGGIVPFAGGGLVAGPTFFPLGGGRLGLMGEAGAEAIMPLSRGPDGRLGVAAGGGQQVSIHFNVTAPDPETFAKSEAQVSALLARAVTRGLRSL